MRAHPAVICTMIAVGGYILSTAAGLGVVTQLLVGDKGPGGLLVSIALAAVGSLLLGYGVRLVSIAPRLSRPQFIRLTARHRLTTPRCPATLLSRQNTNPGD